MTLHEERLTTRPPEQAWKPAAVVFWFYECQNSACEHIERVA
jgi:hypothetical protein